MNHKEILSQAQETILKTNDAYLYSLTEEYEYKKEKKQPVKKVLHRINNRINELLNPPKKHEEIYE